MTTAVLSKPPERPKTLREVLATSGTPVVADIATQYGDSELADSQDALKDQANQWSKGFQADAFLGAGL